MVQDPQLVRSGHSLIAAWLTDDPERSLVWRDVSRGRPLGLINRIGRIGVITQGEAPFADLLSLVSSEGLARIVRLRPDGYDLRPESPVTALMAPVIAGTREQPWAVSIAVSDTPPGLVRLVAYDLRCALLR